MLSAGQVNEFAERGFVLVPQVVQGDLLHRAARRIDELVATEPPATGTTGHHFYFRRTKDEPALREPLTRSPAFGLAEQLAGAGTLKYPWQVQVALNIPPYSHRPGAPHIDSDRQEPTGEPVQGTFTLLACVLMSDQLTENSGNLWVWPGTHLRHAAYFRDHGPQMFCAYPPIDWPEPEQIRGRAGDLLLAHYLLGHNIGGNYASDQTRRALYFRISARDHDAHQDDFLQDPWLDYGPIALRADPGPAAA
ncbi:phytanoyl-CoA dioxygenase family protein [Streptomyces sp. NBC_01198]|uniref:phytanoyl-CoA dioxygenase family protein n=1 Tax=Streptomyces sp. NBC_01198 TaxID=2903769 RepID=UPI002E129CC8|nr:phytanoyl-CoA dioxygenase family protein [Streptomyces sp. NBC_01198]